MASTTGRQLYTADDLLAGFNPWDEMGFALTKDFAIYRQFVGDGGPLPRTVAIRTAQARHDALIADALRLFLTTMQRPLVGVMGGHGVQRNSAAYQDVARLTRHLARNGFLLVTAHKSCRGGTAQSAASQLSGQARLSVPLLCNKERNSSNSDRLLNWGGCYTSSRCRLEQEPDAGGRRAHG